MDDQGKGCSQSHEEAITYYQLADEQNRPMAWLLLSCELVLTNDVSDWL